MADKIVRRDSRGTLIDVRTKGQGTGNTATEESPEAKKRRVEKAWNVRYFRDGLKIGDGIAAAAKIEAYKVANPQWTKSRDAWAQAQVKPKPAPKPGSTLGTLAGVK